MTSELHVPAIRGHMGSTNYFTANFPLGMVVRLFTYDPDKMVNLPVEQRTQRALKRSRIPEIAGYMQEEDYFFSSLTVSVDADWLEFIPSELDENIGVLKLPMETEWIINDGQHRVAGIHEAIVLNPNLRNDSISVLVIADAGLERTQQVFSDLNRNVLKTSRSLDILFDHRSPINRIATYVADNVPLFKGRVDKEHMSLSPHSTMFATLNGVQMATASLLAHVHPDDLEKDYEAYRDIAVEFWGVATKLIGPWNAIAKNRANTYESRNQFIASYQMAIAAVGSVGGEALATGQDVRKALQPLNTIDWTKGNPDWQGLVMVGNEVVTRVTTRRAFTDFLRWKLGFTKKRPQAVLRRTPGRKPRAQAA